jgi:uncharacterized sporulation protein YeaH/YhbH (DUF444 family)
MHVIDRRRNPKSKSLGNRQRFVRRAKAHIRKAVHESIRDRKIADLDGGEEITIDAKDLREPSFGYDRQSGQRDFVLPGNHDYRRGDQIQKPQGGGASGSGGSPDGDGEDSFVFALTRDEFLDIFFEDLQLPNLAKRKLQSMESDSWSRAGYASDGSPQRLNKRETMRRSLARRIALGRPKLSEIEELESEKEQAESRGDSKETMRLRELIAVYRKRMQSVAYIESVDLRFNRFQRTPKPTTQAVMFCLMDTSASMTEDLKNLAKQFYMLLHLFLTRYYRAVEIVFIRHTYTASEVDEESFFHGRETGGTVVSSALAEMLRVVKQRYPVDDWNIYAAQASDGHNFDHDMPETIKLLEQEILPICQYYAYIEVGDEESRGGSRLWDGYDDLVQRYDHFARAGVGQPGEIFPVFRDLFAGSSGRQQSARRA